MAKKGTSVVGSVANSRNRTKTGGRTAAGDHCPLCKKTSSSVNPIVKQRVKSPLLPRSRVFGPRDICRGAKRHARILKGDAELTKEHKGDEITPEWLIILNIYIAHKNGEPLDSVEGYVPPSSVDGPLTIVTSSNDVELFTEVHISNFWPQEDYEEYYGKPALASQLEDGEDSFGKACKGVMRPASSDPDVKPRRVQKIMKRRAKRATAAVEVDRSDQHVREGQGADAFALASSKVDISCVWKACVVFPSHVFFPSS